MKVAIAAKRRDVGMTSSEMIVAMLMLLSLVAIFFVGADAWRRGEDRAACILNIRDVQAAVRSFQNVQGLPDGAEFDLQRDLIGTGKLLEHDPRCPSGGRYSQIHHIPAAGELAVSCSLGKSAEHLPQYTADW